MQKSLGSDTTLELGYLGEHGLHLQRSHLINNAPPGPGALQPRRPYPSGDFLHGTVSSAGVTVGVQHVHPVSTVNLLENTARSWYDGGYVNFRRRYSRALACWRIIRSSKNLSDAPDFRSPMFEAAIPQDNKNLAAEKGPACDVRHRVSVSAVYDICRPEAA